MEPGRGNLPAAATLAVVPAPEVAIEGSGPGGGGMSGGAVTLVSRFNESQQIPKSFKVSVPLAKSPADIRAVRLGDVLMLPSHLPSGYSLDDVVISLPLGALQVPSHTVRRVIADRGEAAPMLERAHEESTMQQGVQPPTSPGTVRFSPVLETPACVTPVPVGAPSAVHKPLASVKQSHKGKRKGGPGGVRPMPLRSVASPPTRSPTLPLVAGAPAAVQQPLAVAPLTPPALSSVPAQRIPNPGSPHVTRGVSRHKVTGGSGGQAQAGPDKLTGEELVVALTLPAGVHTFTQGQMDLHLAQKPAIYSHLECEPQDGFSVFANGRRHTPKVVVRDTGANVSTIRLECALAMGFPRAALSRGGMPIRNSCGGTGRALGIIPAGQVLLHLRHGTPDFCSTTVALHVMGGVGDLYDMLLGNDDNVSHGGHTNPLLRLFVYYPDFLTLHSVERCAAVPMVVSRDDAVCAMVGGPSHWDADSVQGADSEEDCPFIVCVSGQDFRLRPV